MTKQAMTPTGARNRNRHPGGGRDSAFPAAACIPAFAGMTSSVVSPLKRRFHQWPPVMRAARSTCNAIGVTMVLALAAISLGRASLCDAIEITDDLGRTITLAQPARRIIPLYGAFSEMLHAMGAGNRIAARTQADQFPPEILKLPTIGTHMKPNVEMILGLKPDLVIQSEARNAAGDEIAKIREAGIPVAVFGPERFEDLFSVMRRLGVLAGCEGEAEKTVAALGARLQTVKDRVARAERKQKVFFEVRAEPLAASGRGSIVQQVIEAAGAENVLSSPRAIVQVNLETLLTEEVDFYVVQKGPMNRNPPEPARRTHFDRLRAVREGRVLSVDELVFSRPGPRSVQAVEELARAVYPECFTSQ